MSAARRASGRGNRLLTILLAITTVTASAGWFLAAREGRGIPPECYSLEDGDRSLWFEGLHGVSTERSTFAVAESPDEVMVGYWEERSSGAHAAIGYPGRLSYMLLQPLGHRPVVDPGGVAVPRC